MVGFVPSATRDKQTLFITLYFIVSESCLNDVGLRATCVRCWTCDDRESCQAVTRDVCAVCPVDARRRADETHVLKAVAAGVMSSSW